MKRSALFPILALIAIFTSCNSDNVRAEMQNPENEAIANIMTRTSVRDYTDTPVTDEQIETILKAAMSAPTAMNKQPWAFIVIKDRATLTAISDSIPTMKMAKKAPLAIVVCGDMTKTLDGEGHDYWIQDVSAATENLLLATHAQGLGAVWCGVYPASGRVALISDLLKLPDEIIPLAFVPIGEPAVKNEPKDKWNPAKIHNDKW